MKLIQEMDRASRKLDPVQTAIQEMGGDPFAAANAGNTAGMREPEEDLNRIVDHWEREGAQMSDDEMRDAIGNDLEMLEYNPDEAEGMIMKAMEMLGRAG